MLCRDTSQAWLVGIGWPGRMMPDGKVSANRAKEVGNAPQSGLDRFAWTSRACVLGVLCGVLRMAVIGIDLPSLEADPDAYRGLAERWAATGTFGRLSETGTMVATAYRPPLYPWLLSWLAWFNHSGPAEAWSGQRVHPIAIALLHGVLGAWTCVLTWSVGQRLGLTSRQSGLAAMLVLVDPILVRQSMLVMTETTATWLGLLVWWWALRCMPAGTPAMLPAGFVAKTSSRMSLGAVCSGAVLGGLLGMATLCRPTALAWIVLWGGAVLAGWLWKSGRHALTGMDWQRGCWMSFGAAMALAMVLGGWYVRNRVELGVGIATTTHGGYTLYLANNPELYAHWQRSYAREWDEEAFHARWKREQSAATSRSEVELDRLANANAMACIVENPWRFATGCIVRQGWFWALWPSERQAGWWVRSSLTVWYGFVFAMAVGGAMAMVRQAVADRSDASCDRFRSPVSEIVWRWLPGWTLFLSLVLVHSVYWSNMRMRAPLVPLVSLLAAVGIAWIFKAWSEARQARDGRHRPEKGETQGGTDRIS